MVDAWKLLSASTNFKASPLPFVTNKGAKRQSRPVEKKSSSKGHEDLVHRHLKAAILKAASLEAAKYSKIS